VSVADLPVLTALACVAVVALGATVQGTIGIGMGMIASPILVLADRDFIPGAIVIAVVPLGLTVALRERAAIDRAGAGIALVGRVPGVIVGSLTVAAIGHRALAFLVSGSVLFAVAASIVASRAARVIPHNPASLFVAGVASGFTGTATGVGGPPMALTYQHRDAATIRATLSAFFTVGSIMSIVALTASGELTSRQWQLAALVLPGVAVGLWGAHHVSSRLDRERVRPAVLALCAASAIALLLEELL
jgi:uncharacterized membrane protein YfcA